MSRGGYDVLLKKSKTVEGSDVDHASPPRHQIWKQARIKKSGEYTSEASAKVAEKIVSIFSTLIVILILTSLQKILHMIFANYML